MPKSSAMRYSSQRAIHSWSETSSGPSGPTWNSHWPGMTSALMPEMREAGVEARVEVRLDDVTAEHLVGADAAVVEALRRREAAARGKPSGRPSLKNVYSCSMPNSGSCSAYFSATGASSARVFVACGVMSVSSTSHITSMLSPPRIGSGHENTGCSTQSEFVPGAWFVLDPSKPQIGRFSPSRQDLGLRTQPRRRLGAVDPDVLGLDGHCSLRSQGVVRPY